MLKWNVYLKPDRQWRHYCDVNTLDEKYPHIYAKHQYRQESEYGSIVVIYIPIK